MRYIGDILNSIRERSSNQDFDVGTSTSVIEDVVEGIGNQQLLEFVTEGQSHLQSAIVNTHPTEFVTHQDVRVVSGQEEYLIPDNVFVNNRLVSIQYSTTSEERDYYPLVQRPLRDRFTDTSTHAEWYIRRSGKILLNPVPLSTTASIRIEYYRELDRLQLRAGQVSAVTESAGQITALSIGTSSDLPNLINNIGDKYLCICDKDGNVKEYNIPYTSYDSGTGAFTLPAHTRTGLTTITTSDYITVGRYTTTHSDLPFSCERFLVAYGSMMALKTDGSADWTDEVQVIQTMKQDIVDSFGDVDEDIKLFPILDGEILF